MTDLSQIIAQLSEAQEAIHRLPQIEADNRDLVNQLNTAVADISATNNINITLQDEISALRAQIASLEVERDDASFREMEAADKLDRVLSFIKGAEGVIGPKPEPVKAPEPTVETGHEAEQPVEYSIAKQAPALDPRPYAGAHWSDKPKEISWEVFIANGGMEPPNLGKAFWFKPYSMPTSEWIASGGLA